MNKRYVLFLIVCLLGFAPVLTLCAQKQADVNALKQYSSGPGKFFIENKGQWVDSVRFMSHMNGLDLWVTPTSFIYDVYRLAEKSIPDRQSPVDPRPIKEYQREGHVFSMNFIGTTSPAAQGISELSSYYNYFIGNDSRHWASHVSLFDQIQINELYAGVQAMLYYDGSSPRYDLIVQPGANPQQIAYAIEGASGVRTSASGELEIITSIGTITHGSLFAYQIFNNERRPVPCQFVVSHEAGRSVVRFALGTYDHSRPLVIDPLIYSTYIGGSNNDIAYGVQVDGGGNAWVTGTTNSSGSSFNPPQTGPYSYGNLNGYDAFVAKLNPTGSSALFTTFIGGSGEDIARDIALDGTSPYITGYTNSNNYPTTANVSYTGSYDVFVTKLLSDGTFSTSSTLCYSTYLGGGNEDKAFAIDVEGSDAYITGYSRSVEPSSYPVQNPYDQLGDASFGDCILTRLNGTGGILFSTFVGGITLDIGCDVVVKSGTAYVSGYTRGNFPVTPGAYDTTFNLNANIQFSVDAFVFKMNTATSSLEYSTYFGGTRVESAGGIAVDGSYVYITGTTASDTTSQGSDPGKFPVKGMAYDSAFHPSPNSELEGDAYIAKFSFAGNNANDLLYCTYLGGNGRDIGYRVSLDGSYVYVVGITSSNNFPVKPNPGAYYTNYQGTYDIFLSKLDLNASASSGTLVYSTYFGGSEYDGYDETESDIYAAYVPQMGLAHTVVNSTICFSGLTRSANVLPFPFPISPGAYDTVYNGNASTIGDGFVSQFQLAPDQITVTSPTGATVKVCLPDNITVTWNSIGVKNVKIELSDLGGTTFNSPVLLAILNNISSPFSTASVLNIPGSTVPGIYKIRVRDASNPLIVSTTTTILISKPVVIAQQPTNVTVCAGATTASFSVMTSGPGPFTYTWHKAGSPIQTQTNNITTNSLSISNPTTADNGTQYYVLVSNTCATVTSLTVTLTVKGAPGITKQPTTTPTIVCENDPVFLSVEATGASLTYQWQRSPDPSNWGAISGATSSTLSFSANKNFLYYRVIVSTTCGSIFSTPVSLTVNFKPRVDEMDPPELEVCEGTDATLTAPFAAGSGLTKQWQVSTNASVSFSNIIGATGGTLSLLNIPASFDGYRYRVVFHNDCGDSISGYTELHVKSRAHIDVPVTDATICAGDPVQFYVVTRGKNVSYSWTVGSTSFPVDNDTLLLTSVQTSSLSGSVAVTVKVHGECGSDQTTTAILTIRARPQILSPIILSPTIICSGANLQLSVNATGANLRYQWVHNSSNITGQPSATTATYTKTGLQNADAGSYYVVVSGSCNPPVTSNTVTLVVGSAPTISQNPISATVCAGNVAVFSAGATGTPAPTIQWFKNGPSGFQPLTGETNPSLTLNNVLVTQNGEQYRVEFSNPCGAVTSNTVTLTVNTKPTINSQPTDQIVCEGNVAVFSAGATGTPAPTIQWFKNGPSGFQPLTGETNPSLTLNNVSVTQNGEQYRVEFSNPCGAVTSNTVTLTVNTKPTINSQPTDQIVCEGNVAVFSAGATGTPAPTIQWFKNGPLGFQPLAGETNPSLTLNNVSVTQNGEQYRVEFSNPCGAITSNTVTLTVNTKPTINSQPTDQIVCEGNVAVFSAGATGTPAPTIQWFKNSPSGFQPLTGETNPSLTLNNVSVTQNGEQYRVEFSNPCGAVTSNTVTLTVNTKPTINSQPTDQIVCESNVAVFSAGATGTPAPTIQWFKNGPLGFQPLTGETNPSLTLNNVLVTQNGEQYRVEFSNPCGAVTSNTVTLTVNTKPTINSQPTDQIVCEGNVAVFSAGATGTPAPTIQWFKNGPSGFQPLTGETNPSLTLNNVSVTQNGEQYRVEFSNPCGAVTSNTVTLTVNTKPTINSQPTDQIVCEGNVAVFSASATGTPAPTIQWFKNGPLGFQPLTGETNPSLTLNNVSVTQNGEQYRVEFSNPCGAVTSNTVTLTVNTKPTINSQPTDQIVCEGNVAVFSAGATGTPAPTIQWFKNGPSGFQPLTGETNPSLTLNNVLVTQNGEQYRVEFSNPCGAITSNTVTLTVNTKPTINSQPTDQIVCEGNVAVFSAGATGTPAPTIQWFKNGPLGFQPLTGETNPSLTLNNVSVTQNGEQYRVEFSNPCGAITSNTVTLTVNTKPTINSQPTDQIVCEGNVAVFSASATGTPAPTIQWFKNGPLGFQPLTGETNPSLTLNNVSVTQNSEQYRVEFSNPCGAITSNTVTLTVNKKPTVTLQPANQIVCAGETAVFPAQYEGTPPLTVQWYENNGSGFAPMGGETNTTLTLSNVDVSRDGYQYQVKFSNSCGTTTSNIVILTVKKKPTVTLQPSSQVVCEGSTAVFPAQYEGTPPLIVQWYENNGSGFAPMGGETNTTLTLSNVGVSKDGYQYQVKFSNSCGTTTSNIVILTVNTKPIITFQPGNQVICAGETAVFTTLSNGTPAPTAQWYENNGSGFASMGGQTGTTLTLTNVPVSKNGYQYRVDFMNACGTTSSSIVTLTVNAPPSILAGSGPFSQVVCEGSDVQFSAQATGAQLTYQWYKNDQPVTGATTSTLNLTAVTFSDEGEYKLVVSGICPHPVTSAIAILTVKRPPVITTQPISRTVCVGENVTFRVEVSGTAPTFQWKHDGTDIPGALNNELTINNIQLSHAGQYQVIVSGDCPPGITSQTVTLIVNTPPKITLQPQSDTVCAGMNYVLTMNAEGTGLSYQWRKDGTNIPGALGVQLQLNNVSDADAGVYDVVINGTCPPTPVTSASAVIRVLAAPVLTLAPPFAEVECIGQWKDTLITLSNPGSTDLRMLAPSVINGPFSIVNNNPFTIPAGGTVQIRVRFTPVNPGVNQIGTIAFTGQKCATQLLVNVSGTARSVRLLTSNSIQFKPLAQCDSPTMETLRIDNTGDIDVTIATTGVIFSDPQFTLLDPLPLFVPKGGSIVVHIQFKINPALPPNNNIIATASFVGNKCNVTTSATLYARSELIAFDIKTKDLDFGTLGRCENSKTLPVIITNTGSTVLKITSATITNPTFSANFSPATVPVGGSTTVTVTYSGGIGGLSTGILIIDVDRCSQPKSIPLRGNRDTAFVTSTLTSVQFGEILSCDNGAHDTLITIKNNSKGKALIKGALINAPFTAVLQSSGDLDIGQSVQVRVQFPRTADGNYSETLLLPYSAGDCNDTIRITISGSFVTPKIVASVNVMSFPDLQGCETFRDTVIRIKNSGKVKMTLEKMPTDPNNNFEFTLLGSNELQPDEERDVTVRFKPQAFGSSSLTAYVIGQPCSDSIRIDLNGSKRGVNFTTTISNDTLDFGELIQCVANTKTLPFRLTNTSDGTVKGAFTYSITPPFTATLPQGTTLDAGNQSEEYSIEFAPASLGAITNGSLVLTFTSDACQVVKTIVLKGILTDAQLTANGSTNFGSVISGGAPQSRVFTFANTGTTEMMIDNPPVLAPPFTVTGTQPNNYPVHLKPGDTLKVTVEFAPTTTGDHATTLTVSSTIPCLKTASLALSGYGDNAPKPQLVADPDSLDFGGITILATKSLDFTLTNIGTAPCEISGFTWVSSDPNASFTLNVPTFTLQPNGSQPISVQFKPPTVGLKHALLTINSNGGAPEVELQGRGIDLPKGSAIFTIPDLKAEPGQKDFSIPILLTQETNLDQVEIEYMTDTVRLDASLFYPTGVSRGEIISSTVLMMPTGERVREFVVRIKGSDLTTLPALGSPITQVYGDVLLGEKETTVIRHTAFISPLKGTATTEQYDGSLTLINVCTVGGTRLIKLNNSFGTKAIAPNPASDQVEIVVEVPVNGPASLELYSMQGKKVFSREWIVSRDAAGQPKGTSQVFTIPTGDLPSGSYEVVLRATERLDVQRLLIVK